MADRKNFIAWMEEVPEPRHEKMLTYPLVELLFAALVGSLCRMEEWDEIVYFAEENLDWLRRFFPYANGVASQKTFRGVLSRIDQKAFAAAFAAWAGQWSRGGVIAIDGKTLRGTGKSGEAKSALHLLNAFAHDCGMALGQQPVDGKSNEITAIPAFLESLALEGAIVTIDAMGTQKNIAAAIIKEKADYVLALKGNQCSLHDDVRRFFADPVLTKDCRVHKETDAGHGRIEERACVAADATQWLRDLHPEWTNLQSIAAITAMRADKKTGKTSSETRFYITSLPPDPDHLLHITRAHWSVENKLHWTLDVIFREDRCRIRKDHAPANLALIRKIALNLLRQDTSKIPLKRKRLKAAIDSTYRASLINAS
jgi:predicted transposase YbfD/YdcC